MNLTLSEEIIAFYITANRGSNFLALSFLITNRKTERNYKCWFGFLAKQLSLTREETLISDMELGISNAAHACWKDVKTKLCWFHVCQVLFLLSMTLNKFLYLSQNTENCLKKLSNISWQLVKYLKLELNKMHQCTKVDDAMEIWREVMSAVAEVKECS